MEKNIDKCNCSCTKQLPKIQCVAFNNKEQKVFTRNRRGEKAKIVEPNVIIS